MAPKNDNIEVRVLRNRAEIEPLRDFWNSYNPTRDADLDYFLFIIDLYPEALRPHVVVLYDEGKPKALLAGRLEQSRIPIRFGRVALPFPKVCLIQFVHGGALGEISAAAAELLIGNVIECLCAQKADAAYLHYFDVGSPLVKAAGALPGRFCSDNVATPQRHWMREMSGCANGFLSSLSQNARYQQRKRSATFEKDFPSKRMSVFQCLDVLDQLMRDADVVAKKSYQRGLGVGFSQTPVIRARLEFEAQKGWLRAYVLYFNDRPVAFWIGSLRNRMFLSDYLAFDPSYSDYAPGIYLLMRAIDEHLVGDPRGRQVDLIDMGGGNAGYKERLGSFSREETSMYIFAPRISPISLNLIRMGTEICNQAAKSLLQRAGVFAKVKKFWRKRKIAQKPRE